jgi:hypothetical protein
MKVWMVDKFYGDTQFAQQWKMGYKWLPEKNLYGKDENVPRD